MMPGSADSRAGLQAQRLVGESLRLVFGNLGTLFILALAPSLIIEAALLAVAPESGAGPEPEFGMAFVVATLLSGLAGQVVVALVTLMTVDRLTGRTRSLDQYFGIVIQRLFPIFLVGLAVSLVVGLGAMAFVLPGIYVYAMFFVWQPCMLFEGQGFAAMSRARMLTRGHRWPIIGAIVALFLLMLGSVILLRPLWTALPDGGFGVLAPLLRGLYSALSYAVAGAFGALVYLRLRFLEDGTLPEQVAASV